MLETNIIDKIINKVALKQYEKQKQKERPIYGIVVDANSEYDDNGCITKIHDVEVAYLLANQLCKIVIPAENAYLGCFPIYPGIVVKFCSEQLNSNDLERKMKTAYIMRVDRRLGDNFPREVYQIARMYTDGIEEIELNSTFWFNLDLVDQEKRQVLLKKM